MRTWDHAFRESVQMKRQRGNFMQTSAQYSLRTTLCRVMNRGRCPIDIGKINGRIPSEVVLAPLQRSGPPSQGRAVADDRNTKVIPPLRNRLPAEFVAKGCSTGRRLSTR